MGDARTTGRHIAVGDLFGSRYLYGASNLSAMAQMMQRAAVFGQRVEWFRCSRTKTNCLRWVTLRADF